MKRLMAVMLCLCMIFSLAACGEGASAEASTAVLPAASALAASQTTAAAADTNTLTLVVDGQEILITLYDTPAANALYDMLPLELQFEDFNHTEKISDLPEELPTEEEPDGCDPDIGDLCLYAPWGNLSVFYQDFPYSEGLIPLGHVDAGMDLIANQTGDFFAILKRAE